jgi:hypothetical protein
MVPEPKLLTRMVTSENQNTKHMPPLSPNNKNKVIFRKMTKLESSPKPLKFNKKSNLLNVNNACVLSVSEFTNNGLDDSKHVDSVEFPLQRIESKEDEEEKYVSSKESSTSTLKTETNFVSEEQDITSNSNENNLPVVSINESNQGGEDVSHHSSVKKVENKTNHLDVPSPK